MSFTAQALEITQPVFRQILAHPFLAELAAGTLRKELFTRYIQQDALYLADYAKALSLLAAKAPDGDSLLQMGKFAEGALVVERSLHEQYLSQLGAEHAPAKGEACFAYTQYLLAACATQPYAIGLAAVLPCFRIYTDVGHAIVRAAAPNNPYQAWIDTYSNPEFDLLTTRACQMADNAFAQANEQDREAMFRAYGHGAWCEYWFWDDAWRNAPAPFFC